jgi:putative methionine-R-sulfoxide reductase with GAF domain
MESRFGMEIEDRIRTRIEAILINDARNFTEIKKMAADDEPLEAEDILTDERNLYHRIINSYRNAVSEVNKLLEGNIESLSGFCHIVESIKEKEDFQEICSQIVDCILQDFGVDYSGLLFREGEESLCLEGIREDRKFLRIHSQTGLLGSKEFEVELTRMVTESADCLNIEDVYKEPCFNAVDFPSVVRSVLCLPILLHNEPRGFLILSHSLPSFFQDNHVRVLKILASLIAHLRFLHQKDPLLAPLAPPTSPVQESSEKPDAYAVVLMEFDAPDAYGRRVPLEKKAVSEIRMRIQSTLQESDSVLFYEERELLVFMPGVSSELLPARVRGLREAFNSWQADRCEGQRNARVNMGFSVCEGEEGLSRTLEVASLVMHPEADEGSETLA